MRSKSVHLVVALVTIILGGGFIAFVPDLRKDVVTNLGTIGFFVGVYGVVFTIIEVIRAKSAADEAAVEAKKAAGAVRTLYGIKNLSECQSMIGFALDNIEKDGFASLSALAQIIKLYSAEFSKQYGDAGSNCRQNVALVQSYVSFHTPRTPAPTNRLKDALVAMVAELSVSGSEKTQEISI
jgi:hypothetical protein